MIAFLSINNIKDRVHTILKNSLFMNAFYLMVSTFILGACGFTFWIIVTQTYNTEAVGLATTLLSVSGLVSLLGLAGFDTTFIRFLPSSHRKNDYINTGLIVSLLASLGLGVCVGLVLLASSPSFSILADPWAFASFVFFTSVTSLNTLTGAIFLAFKQARYVLLVNALFSVFKILLPLLVAEGGAVTIFVIAGMAQLFGLSLSLLWLHRKFNYRMSPVLHVDTLRVVRKFSLSIYTSNILSLIPPTLLPLVILHNIGAKNAAYYYMAYTIAGILHTVVYASMQSVLAEGSHNAKAIRSHVISAVKFITSLLLPVTLLTFILSDSLLTVFGSEYAESAGNLLRLLVLGILPIAAYGALTTNFKVTKQLAPVIYMNSASALIILGMSSWLVPRMGLESVGWSWIIGNGVACCIGLVFLARNKRKDAIAQMEGSGL